MKTPYTSEQLKAVHDIKYIMSTLANINFVSEHYNLITRTVSIRYATSDRADEIDISITGRIV